MVGYRVKDSELTTLVLAIHTDRILCVVVFILMVVVVVVVVDNS